MATDAEVSWSCKDGDKVHKGQKFGSVKGKASCLLKAERIALNFMQRMSGIATATAEMQRECEVRYARSLSRVFYELSIMRKRPKLVNKKKVFILNAVADAIKLESFCQLSYLECNLSIKQRK